MWILYIIFVNFHHRCSTGDVKPIEVKVRPKGLGLGAEQLLRSSQEQQDYENKKKTDSKETLIVKSGAFVRIIGGTHQGKYGQVNLKLTDVLKLNFLLGFQSRLHTSTFVLTTIALLLLSVSWTLVYWFLRILRITWLFIWYFQGGRYGRGRRASARQFSVDKRQSHVQWSLGGGRRQARIQWLW